MTSQNLKRLNHYPEFRTDAGITQIIDFIANDVDPQGLNERQLERYQEKFGNASGFQVTLDDQHLFYHPNANIDLEVVKPDERQEKMELVFDDIQRGLGKGLSSFYHEIAMSYLNIPKKVTDDFLRSQGDYTVGIVPHRLVNKPIITKVPNERWGVDLINMEAYVGPANQNRRFIFTAVDYFSGKVFARGMCNNRNNPEEPTLSRAIADICEKSHTTPHIIQADSEFLKGEFLAWCQNHHITIIKTSSYTPVSNGKVERMNRELRRKIKAGIIRNNNSRWNENLQDYVMNINNQQNSRNGMTPNQLWSPGFHPHPQDHVLPEPTILHDDMTKQQKMNYNETLIDNRARDLLSSGRSPHVFEIGDLVRIKLLVMNNKQREVREKGLGLNKTAVHYTPEIYRVVNAFHHPPNFIRRDEYTLRDLNTNRVLLSGMYPRKFFGNDLMLTPAINDDTHIHPKTIRRALILNRFER